MICGKTYGIVTQDGRYKGIYITTTNEGVLMKNVIAQWTAETYNKKYFNKNDTFYDLEFIPKYKMHPGMRDIYSIDQMVVDWDF